MKNGQITAFCDGVIFTGEAFVENHAVLTAHGKIMDIVAASRIPAEAQRLSHAGKILTAGFIDCQVNGGGNRLLNNDPSAAIIRHIADAHRRYGTTALLPTLMTDSREKMRAALAAVREARAADASILGIHFEGPHLSANKKGVHEAAMIRAMDDEDITLYKPQDGEIILITVAPEMVSVEQIKKLRAQGTTIALGHSAGTAEQTRAALDVGASGFTHLYNTMEPISSRAPNVAGTALDDRGSWCSLIADGHHVSDAMLRVALYAKPAGKVFLVSDAMPPSASEKPEPFELYGEKISYSSFLGARSASKESTPSREETKWMPASAGMTVLLPRCENAEGRLAGSAIVMADAVHYCIAQVGIEPDEALRMASLYPAQFLGLGKTHGKLLPGYVADIIALNTDFTLSHV